MAALADARSNVLVWFEVNGAICVLADIQRAR
jgi:hypothetical protein